MLTEEIANQFLECYSSVDLRDFTSIEDDAAKVLANYRHPEGEDEDAGRLVHTALSIKNTRSMLKLSKLKLDDSGDYSIKVENDFHVKWENFSLEVTDKPQVSLSVLEPADNGLYQVGKPYSLQCTGTGYPVPKITWTFKRCQSYNNCETHKQHYGSSAEAANG